MPWRDSPPADLCQGTKSRSKFGKPSTESGDRFHGVNNSPVARLGGSWIWHLLYGLISIGTGIIAVAWPGPTLIVLAVIFGVQLIATGMFRLVGSASLGEAGTARALTAILGVVSLLLGLYALRHVLITVLALGLLLGIYWIVDGFTAVFAAVDHPGLPGRGWNIFSGLLGVIAGLMLLAWPSLSLLTLSFLAGLWLIMLGAMQLGLARDLRTRPRAAVA